MIDLTNAVTGLFVQKAKLVVHDLRKVAAEAERKAIEAAQQQGEIPAGFNLTTVGAALARTPAVSAANALAGKTSLPAYDREERKIFNVQFNPSQISLNVSALPAKQIDQSTKRSTTESAVEPKLILNLPLVFDDMDRFDAFPAENVTNLLTVAGAANLLMKGKTHSVQPQVEALLGALRNPYTRNISFEWADFVFIGQLIAIQANYTMFSPKGKPIRAEVNMRLQHEMDSTMLKNWYDNFNTVFGGASSSLKGKLQDVGSLLNVKL